MLQRAFNKIKPLVPKVELKRNPNEISIAANALKNSPLDVVKNEYMKQPYLNRSFLETNMVNDESKFKALGYLSKDGKKDMEKLKDLGYVINKGNELKEKGINATNKFVNFDKDTEALNLKKQWNSESGGKKNRKTKRRKNRRKNTRRKKM